MDTTLPNKHKSPLKEKAIEEFRLYWMVFLFLALMFGAFTTYRRLIMREVGVDYAHWGAGLIQAAIIAKVILIGQAMSVGKRIERRPLIVSVLVKAFLYGLLVAAFDVIERVIEGLLHRHNWQVIAHDIVSKGPEEMLAKSVMIFVAFVPFFALWEIARVLGPGKLREMFFHVSPA